MKNQKVSEVNRIAWNEAAPIHMQYTFDAVVESLNSPEGGCLDEVALDILSRLGVRDLSVTQLCCNNGRELITIKKLGASNCVGFDISDGFIEQAKRLVQCCGIPCEFVRSDILDISHDFDAGFDLVVLTKGTLGWQPDLCLFFGVVSRILKPGGKLFIYEMHPLLDVFWDAEKEKSPRPKYSYFRCEPFVDYSGLDFFTMTSKLTSAPAYWYHHKLSSVLNAIISNRLVIDTVEEYPHDISIFFKQYETHKNKLPLSYSLLGHKGIGGE